MRALRGLRISTVFQDPMGALNPVISVGRQMINIQYRSGNCSKAEKAAKRDAEMLRLVRIPDAESALVALSAPVLGRHEAADRDRDGADDGACAC